MKKIKKVLSLILGGMMAISTACAPLPSGGDNSESSGAPVDASKTTVIEVAVHNGGVRWNWLEKAFARFKEQVGDKSYAPGKKGVEINITPGNGLANKAMATDGYNIYFVERTDTYSFIASDLLMDITEVFEMTDDEGVALKDRIYPEMLPALRGDDPDKYYVLPWVEFYSGMSYDADAFDYIGSYFAAPGESGVTHTCNYGTATFVGRTGAKKACGPDGVYNTNDDGLASSLQELLILCDYQKNNNVEPITISGKYIGYCVYLLAGLWSSLAGYDQMKTVYEFDGTPVEIIKSDANGNLMFTNEPLFEGVDYIKKPVTEMVPITEENGYLTHDMAAKYYAAAFLEVLEKDGLFSQDARLDVNHTQTELNLLLGGKGAKKRKGMLIDGTYWWVESELAGNFSSYSDLTGEDVNTRNVKFMPLPTSVNTTTTEGNGEKGTMIETGMGVCYVNNNIKNNEELKNASLDLLKFLYSEQELIEFTKNTGSKLAIDYDVDSDDIPSVFYSNLIEMRDSSNVLRYTAKNDNSVFKKHRGSLKIELSAEVFRATLDKVTYNNFLQVYRTTNFNSADVFNATRFTKAEWDSFV